MTRGRQCDITTQELPSLSVVAPRHTAAPRASAAEPPRLVVVLGQEAGRKQVVIDTVLIGRASDCQIRLEDSEVSRRHCLVGRQGGEYVLEDLGSRNGTSVNGAPVRRHVLRYGDRIQVGRSTVLLFTHHDPLKEALLQRQKMEALGQLGAGIAHDLNNLLGALTASMQHLQSMPGQRTLSDAEVYECHEDIASAITTARDLTKRLLRFARRGEHKQSAAVGIEELVTDVAQLVRRSSHASLRVLTETEPGLAVRGDRTELHQALMNLCLNARDAMPGGGTLTLRAERLEAMDAAEMGLLARGPLVCISVIDTGVGMDEHTRERIFEPFFSTKKQGGSGLGLTTVYEIVGSHGGQLDVTSELGAGSIFRLLIPLSADTPAVKSRGVPRVTQASEGNDRTGVVMLVDDQDLVRRAAGRLLKAAGHEVVLASGGREALARYYAGPRPDVVILDLDMPDMCGDECWRRLREIDPKVRAFFLSGSCDERKRQTLLRDGALGFLEKPVDASVLRDAVSRAIAG